jgi:hypothetical protein
VVEQRLDKPLVASSSLALGTKLLGPIVYRLVYLPVTQVRRVRFPFGPPNYVVHDWKSDRVVYRTGLENRRLERDREFESHLFRQ